MSTAKKIRWGVIGYARIAHQHVMPAIVRSNNSVLQAVASRDPAKLQDCKQKFNCPNLHDSYEALLRNPEVDAVYIPLPNSLHREWTIEAAEHGKHVLCEKPVALNAAECRNMIAACKKHNVVFMEAFMYRYSDTTRKVLQVLRSGVLGDIKYIYSAFRFPLTWVNDVRSKPELGGGSLYDVGCYTLNFVGMVVDEVARIQSAAAGKPVEFGPVPEAISAQSIKEGGVDVCFAGLLKYPNGIIASISSGFNAQKQLESQIIGTKGILYVPNTFFEAAGYLTRTVEDVEAEKIAVEQSDRYKSQVEDFADAILNKRAPYFSLVETQRNMEIMDKLYAAC